VRNIRRALHGHSARANRAAWRQREDVAANNIVAAGIETEEEREGLETLPFFGCGGIGHLRGNDNQLAENMASWQPQLTAEN